ncbi:hypothetical protein Ddye_024468 [Dipteronia dyeriana]|uniref:Uncharacterized protein n=1 Tax=Dipteronia dyeriana TaxID=168575 RepID=A0AAD9WUG8_9ROSI|nr:hypothetical protein Ddye_024468 [Dipteronia dyeriana]
MVIGKGDRDDFWNDIKWDSGSLKAAFPKFFALAVKKSGPILEFGRWIDSKWVWGVKVMRFLFDWEKDQWCCFQALLSHITIRKHISDALAWKFNSNGIFSVGSFRKGLEKMVDGQGCFLQVQPVVGVENTSRLLFHGRKQFSRYLLLVWREQFSTVKEHPQCILNTNKLHYTRSSITGSKEKHRRIHGS